MLSYFLPIANLILFVGFSFIKMMKTDINVKRETDCILQKKGVTLLCCRELFSYATVRLLQRIDKKKIIYILDKYCLRRPKFKIWHMYKKRE